MKTNLEEQLWWRRLRERNTESSLPPFIHQGPTNAIDVFVQACSMR